MPIFACNEVLIIDGIPGITEKNDETELARPIAKHSCIGSILTTDFFRSANTFASESPIKYVNTATLLKESTFYCQ